MEPFNVAYDKVLAPERMTLGLMTPFGAWPDRLPDIEENQRLATLADQLGFAALWARDVPLMIPQGSENTASALDDPFLWLAGMAFATQHIAIGAAAIVSPLRHPLHVAKAAMSLDRLSNGRFILGLGSGDRPEEFVAFGEDLEARREAFRERWHLLRAALSPSFEERKAVIEYANGYDLMPAPQKRIPMIVVGSARQSVQWIAQYSEAWATYHRPEARQEGRVNLWKRALEERSKENRKPFIQSTQLELLEEPDAPAEPLELGLRGGRHAVIDYLDRMRDLGIAHTIINLTIDKRPANEVIQEIGEDILPGL